MINKTLVNTIPVEIPSNKQSNVQQLNGQINLELLNNQQEELIYPIIENKISNHDDINVGNLN